MPTGGVDQLATAQVDQSQTGANTSGKLPARDELHER